MSNKKKVETVSTVLYTSEAELSRKKVEDELKIPDPPIGQAEAAIQENIEDDKDD